jgi:hypothetical protein
MMFVFDVRSLMEGDVLGIRAYALFSKLIRAIIGSFTNHNAVIVRATQEALDFLKGEGLLAHNIDEIKAGDLCIAEAISPRSTLTSLRTYEDKMNKLENPVQVRVWRVPIGVATQEERVAVSALIQAEYLGVKYPLSVGRLWVLRFVNSLPWKIHGEWCTILAWEPWERIVPGVNNRPTDGKAKKNPTPRTYENRLVAGVYVDITSLSIVPIVR